MRTLLLNLFDAAIAAVSPAVCLIDSLPPPTTRPTVVLGAGKAAASMADVVVRQYAAPLSGAVVTRYGHGLPDNREIPGLEVLQAGHPMPDDASLIGGQRVLQLALNAGEGDRLLVLISGGASALIEHPLPGVSLADIRTINRQLLKAGADIKEINTVRKKISAIKGGRLAVAAMPAEVFLLAISDVPGDCLSDIGSGPCSPDTTSPADAREILRRYHCDVPVGVLAAINNPNNTPPAPNYPAFAHVTSRVIARAKDALDAVSRVVGEAGYEPVRLGDDISTSARDLAAEHARLAMQHRSRQGRYALISGGETSVQVVNPEGRGGRNTEYLLSLALALDGASGIWALAADTDGIDGTEDNAGATISPDTLVHATRLGLDGPAMLADNLSYDFFAAVEGLLVTGPTGTNVNDLRIILIDGSNATH